MSGERNDLGAWRLTVTNRSGSTLHDETRPTSRAILQLAAHALRGNLDYPELPRQTVLTIAYEEPKP